MPLSTRVAAFLLALIIAASAGAQVEVELIVDASTAMWGSMEDGRPRFVAVREAVSCWLAGLPSEAGLHVGLRVMGGATAASGDRPCDDSRLQVPIGILDRPALSHAIGDLLPVGRRPLIQSVVRAAADLSDEAEHRRIIVLTAGEEGCLGVPREAAEALAGGVDLRVIGLRLGLESEARFSAVAPVRNAAGADELVEALAWAIEDLEIPMPEPASVAIDVIFDGKTVTNGRLSLKNLATGAEVGLAATPGGFAGSVPPSRYSAAVELTDVGRFDFEGLEVVAASDNRFQLDLDPPAPVRLDLAPEPALAGGLLFVGFQGAPPGSHRVAVVPRGTGESWWVDRTTVEEPAGEVVLRAPEGVDSIEVRFEQRLAGGVIRVIGRAMTANRSPVVQLEIPEQIAGFEELSVPWQGPDQPGDYLALTVAGGDPSDFVWCSFSSGSNPATLVAPGAGGGYRLRYVSGASGRTLTSVPVEVSGHVVTLQLPEEVGPGERFEVQWRGPDGDDDFLAVAPVAAPDGEYLSFAHTGSGNPLRIESPRASGDYELRYVDGRSAATLGRVPLRVVEVPVSLAAAPRVGAGTRIEIRWTGPDLTGDLIAVARRASPTTDYLDWTYTSIGSPTTLAAPFRPGKYELRYISEGQVLASRPIVVD